MARGARRALVFVSPPFSHDIPANLSDNYYLFFLANSAQKALVLDTCMGVVTAAMLERMGCKGRIIALYAQSQPSMDAVRLNSTYSWYSMYIYICRLYI